ncbi:transposase, N-terminal [Rhodococcus gordoniae]|uniref:Transposase, N-terminal n=1 Tax=Rhodococcus gordoniae TaxID=223392 RepID=A0A379PMT0_9NOCA|nr:transposase, N-terminal [Rhodococcus gordoniae]
MRKADIEDGLAPGTTAGENAELREARKRIRLLEQENEGCCAGLPRTCRRRIFRENDLPARPRAGRRRDPRRGGCAGSWGSHGNRTIGGSLIRSPIRSSRRPIGRTHCSTPIVKIRSSAIGFSPTRPARRVSRCRTAQPGGSARPTDGGASSGRDAVRRRVVPGPPVHDDLVGRVFTADKPNHLWLNDITEHRTDEASSICVRSRTSTRTGSWATRSATG